MEEKKKLKHPWKNNPNKFYSSKDGLENINIPSGIYHAKFEFHGKFNTLSLEKLKKEGYERTYPTHKNHVIEGALEIISYFKEPYTITLSANKIKHEHEIRINFSNPIKDIKEIQEIKSKLENILNKNLEIIYPPIKEIVDGVSEN